MASAGSLTEAEAAQLMFVADPGYPALPFEYCVRGYFSDVALVLHDRVFASHRTVLASRSPLFLRSLIVAGEKTSVSSSTANDSPTLVECSATAPPPSPGGSRVVVAATCSRLDASVDLPSTVAHHADGIMRLVYEGWNPHAGAGKSVGMTLEETLCGISIAAARQMPTLESALTESALTTLDVDIEGCLLALHIAGEHELRLASFGPGDAIAVSTKAAHGSLGTVLSHCATVTRFMLGQAVLGCSEDELVSLCEALAFGEDVALAASQVTQPPLATADDAAVVVLQPTATHAATRASQRSSQAPFIMLTSSASNHAHDRDATNHRRFQAANSDATAAGTSTSSPLTYLRACITMAPPPIVVVGLGSLLSPERMDNDEAGAIKPEPSTDPDPSAVLKSSLAAAALLLHRCQALSQRALLPGFSLAGQEEETVVSAVASISPLIAVIPPSIAMPLFVISSVSLRKGGAAAVAGSHLARLCLIAASGDPPTFTASWVHHLVRLPTRDETPTKPSSTARPTMLSSSVGPQPRRPPSTTIASTTTTATGSASEDMDATMDAPSRNRTARPRPSTEGDPDQPDRQPRHRQPAAVSGHALHSVPLFNDTYDASPRPESTHTTKVQSLTLQVAAARTEAVAAVEGVAARVAAETGQLRTQILEAAKSIAASFTDVRKAEAGLVESQRQVADTTARLQTEIANATRVFVRALEGLYAFEDEVAGSVLPELRRRQDETFWDLKTAMETEFRHLDRTMVNAGHESPLRIIAAVLQGHAAVGPPPSIPSSTPSLIVPATAVPPSAHARAEVAISIQSTIDDATP